MREYLEFEFGSLKGRLSFPFDLESIIDDWVMMGFLVGNDFIPHLPHMHINEDALPFLYTAYTQVLPTLDGECAHACSHSRAGYINNKGYLNVAHFAALVRRLAEVCFVL
jgi:5'-3' exoribonuclease 1